MRGAALDAEHVDVQVGSDLVAHTDTVSEKVEQGQDLHREKSPAIIPARSLSPTRV